MNSGAFGENFPYSNFHDLNMDWIIKIAKDFLDQYTHIQEMIENGEESLENLTTSGLAQLQEKADTLEALLQAWYNDHSQDIADQLADALADLNEWYNTHENYLDNTLAENIAEFNSSAEAKSRALLDSWPDDYSELVEGYNEVKSNLNSSAIGIQSSMTTGAQAGVFYYFPVRAGDKIRIASASGNNFIMNRIDTCDASKNTLQNIGLANTGGSFNSLDVTMSYDVYYWKLGTSNTESVIITNLSSLEITVEHFDLKKTIRPEFFIRGDLTPDGPAPWNNTNTRVTTQIPIKALCEITFIPKTGFQYKVGILSGGTITPTTYAFHNLVTSVPSGTEFYITIKKENEDHSQTYNFEEMCGGVYLSNNSGYSELNFSVDELYNIVDDIPSKTENLVQMSGENKYHFKESDIDGFGYIGSAGNIGATKIYEIKTKIISFDYDININAKDGYVIHVMFFNDDDAYSGNKIGWINYVSIPKNQKFILTIRKNPEDTTDYLRTDAQMIALLNQCYYMIDNPDAQIPFYWKTHIIEKERKIFDALSYAGLNKSSFLFFTDQHWGSNAKNSPALIKHIMSKTPLKFLIGGGDIVTNEESKEEALATLEDFQNSFKFARGRFYNVLGNHDHNNNSGNNLVNRLTTGEMYATIFEQSEPTSRWGEYFCYYADNESDKTRYIFLDTGWFKLWNTGRLNPIINALNDMKPGWKSVVVTHYIYADGIVAKFVQVIFDMLDDYNSRSSGSIGFDNYETMVTENNETIPYNFTNAEGKVVLIVGGHVHLDNLTIKTTGGIPVAVFDTDSLRHLGSESVSQGTITEQCITAVIADIDNSVIRCIRIGRGTDHLLFTGTRVTGISLNNLTMSISAGTTNSDLQAIITPQNAGDKIVYWSSSDETKVIVNNGIIKGIASGQAIITATTEDGNYTATCTVTVS